MFRAVLCLSPVLSSPRITWELNSEKEEEKNYKKAATLSTNIMLTSLTIERDVKLSIGIPSFSHFKTWAIDWIVIYFFTRVQYRATTLAIYAHSRTSLIWTRDLYPLACSARRWTKVEILTGFRRSFKQSGFRRRIHAGDPNPKWNWHWEDSSVLLAFWHQQLIRPL